MIVKDKVDSDHHPLEVLKDDRENVEKKEKRKDKEEEIKLNGR